MDFSKVSNMIANGFITTNLVVGANPNANVAQNIEPVKPKTTLSSPDKLFKNSNNSNSNVWSKPKIALNNLEGLNNINKSSTLNLFANNSGMEPPTVINENTRVLHIGDSHTVGIYGREMDNLMRKTGAKVQTYGSAGSSPSWWLNGHSTKSGFYSKDDEGKVDSPADWKAPHETPKLNNLINNFKPNVIIISLGANLIKASGEQIEKEVKILADIAKESGAKIIWVGPPDGRESVKPDSKQSFLYDHLQKVAQQYGTFLDSRPYTEYPATGGDGIHYWGKEGSEIAKSWASNIFHDIQISEQYPSKP